MKKFLFTFTLLALSLVSGVAYASETKGTILTPTANDGYAWSNQAGWVNFGATNSNIQITDSGITGYAWSNNYGWINMSPTNGGVSVAANGALSGYAWGQSLGWINFSGVSINSSGKFVGLASGTIIGTFTFDCGNCSVATDYRPINFRTTITTTTESVGTGRSGERSRVIQEIQPIESPPSLVSPTSISQPAAQLVTEETAPAQLFDIRLLLDRSNVARIIDLVARVTFESFGRVPTPVEITFSILGTDGQELWKSVDTTTVQTEAVFVKRFSDAPELSLGSYTLRLSTLYNTDVTDVFEAPFTISSVVVQSYWLAWLIGSLIFAILIIFFILWKRWRKDMEENNDNRITGF